MILQTFESFFNRNKEPKHPLHDILSNFGWSLNGDTKLYDKDGEFDLMFTFYNKDGLAFKDGIKFPIGTVKGFDDMKMPMNSVENFPKRIEGEMIARGILVNNFEEWKPEYCSGLFRLEGPNIENLKGLENMTMFGDFYINRCRSLTSLEGCPNMSNNVLEINDCPNLKTLSSLKGVDILDVDVRNCGVPRVEAKFVKEKIRFGIENYWKDLYGFVIYDQDYESSYDIQWPEEFFNQLPEEYQNRYKSKSGINKYNL